MSLNEVFKLTANSIFINNRYFLCRVNTRGQASRVTKLLISRRKLAACSRIANVRRVSFLFVSGEFCAQIDIETIKLSDRLHILIRSWRLQFIGKLIFSTNMRCFVSRQFGVSRNDLF